MKTKIVSLCAAILFLGISHPTTSMSADLTAGEKSLYDEFRSHISQGKLKTIDDLYAKCQEIQAGTSKALIVDIRTEAEFDAGHIIGSSNVDSGHAYGMPKKIKDPNTEIWVFCRTQHRASYFVGMLYKYGYKNVYLVEGGMKAWSEKGYPLVNKYLGEFTVFKYQKQLKEDFWYRENK